MTIVREAAIRPSQGLASPARPGYGRTFSNPASAMTPIDTIAALLSKTGMFSTLEGADLTSIAQAMRPAEFGSGETIFQRGDPGRELYLVTEGRVRLSILTAEGRELSFAHATAGHVFGEMATLDGRQRSADATAVTKVRAMILTQPVLNRLIDSRPPVARAMITFLCARLRDTDQQLEAIALHPIEVRLARLFLSAIKLQGLTPKAGKVALTLGMSQSELGLLIGASRPKVNGALATLEDSGAITKSDDAIMCNVMRLEQVAEYE
jgi:CRP/FNR family transcriptional regulator, cyclic AMP receptor protein